MGAPPVLLTALLLLLPAFSYCQLYNLIAPNVFRVDTDEKVIIECHDCKVQHTVDIRLQDFPHRLKLFHQTKTTLNAANDFLSVTTVKIPANYNKLDEKQKQFVYLTVKSDEGYPAFQLEKVILISFQSGYIFVQTDKPLYTPMSKVQYRLFTVDYQLTPISAPTIVDFVNPDGIIVNREMLTAEGQSGIIPKSFSIPGIVNLGVWKIVAKYKNAPHKNFSAEFEVKEYVLPSFEVKVEPSRNFFYVDDEALTFQITAKYLYGEHVNGIAYVLFGVRLHNEKNSLPESLRRIPIESGKGVANLTRDMLLTRFPHITELVDHSVYVTVTVLTNTGSDIEEAEKTGIQIVTSPYKILFTKTPKYFKPGMPFSLTISVTNPDGSPATGIPVVAYPSAVRANTNGEGIAKLPMNTNSSNTILQIMVKTNCSFLPDARQASASMVAQPYSSKDGLNSYLHIGVDAKDITAGGNIDINFYAWNERNKADNIKYFTYVIMSRGQIIEVGRQTQSDQNFVVKSLTVTTKLIPSFRILAYYTIDTPRGKEVISDSIWIDVKDTCLGTLKVEPAEDGDRQIQAPGDTVNLKLIGDPGARVGLVAVDKAVYVLNKKNKMTQMKIWELIEKNDIGCTPGGGANNMGVFYDAGLVFHSTAGISTDSRTVPDCSAPTKRKRRSAVLMQAKGEKASKYQDNRQLKKCCEDGMYENPMGHSCEQRAEYIMDGKPCVDAFLDCCNYVSKLRKEKQVETLIIARSDEDDYIQEEDIRSRSSFPESWLWELKLLPSTAKEQQLSSQDLSLILKDSITTWEIQAVSLSPTKGICVAEPYEITVMKKFFIELRLPYSVVRNEQVEIKAVVYNYSTKKITVRIQLVYNPDICSAATARKKYLLEYTIHPKSSIAVPYVIVPMIVGEIEIEVKGSVKGDFVSDGIIKKLRVVPEGMDVTENTVSVILDPASKGKDGRQEVLVKAVDMKDVVPNTEPLTYINIKGDLVGETIENSIDGANLKHLLQVPTGCGEQNMISMTPAVIVTYYLDNTNQWERLGPDRRAEAIKYITQGYTQQMKYRKDCDAYAAFEDRPPSTWLTAYVVKVFSMAYRIISVESKVLCGAVIWLIKEKLKANGVFKEDAPVIHGEMIGGFQGAEPDASLTAFVLIALSEARGVCHTHVQNLEESIKSASDYLKSQYETLKRPYTIAIVSYALSLENQVGTEDTLMKASTNKTHWEDPNSDQYTIEATAYALLTLVKLKKYELAGPVVRWLTEKRFYGGGSGSTQSTIMVFQALAQYIVEAPRVEDFDLDVLINLPGRKNPPTIRINKGNALLGKSERTKANEDFTVVASGTGQATLYVKTIYNKNVKKEQTICKKFDLNVTTEEVVLDGKSEPPFGSVYITICARYLGETNSSMAILDVSMLTGFSPDLNHLNRLKDGVDKYISSYELNKVLSDKGSLIIYLDKVSNKKYDCLKIKADQLFKGGLLKPAAVTVYDYYSIENRCTKFYHAGENSELLNRLCVGDICRCAEENCGLQRKYDKSVSLTDRINHACEPGVDFVYKTKLLSEDRSVSYDYYKMEILEIIKAGSDDVKDGSQKTFITNSNCRDSLNLQVNRQYLIIGQSTDLWNLQTEMAYMISSATWVEWWPADVECQDSKYQAMCLDFQEFSDNIMIFGCPH